MNSRAAVIVSVYSLMASTTLVAQEPRTGFAEVNGGRLYYEMAGSGTPVVLIHGNFGDRRHWDEQYAVFARQFQVVRYDVRGFGKSSNPQEGVPYSHHEDLAALLGHLGIEKAHVIGLSMGSAIATSFVLAHPEMSRSLVSVGPWVAGYNSDSEPVRGMWAAFGAVREALAQGGCAAAISAWSTAPFWIRTTPNAAVRARFQELGAEYGFWALSHRDPAVALKPAAVSQLGSIRAPTLAVTAELDMTIEVAELIEKSIPGARKVLISDAGHLMQMDNPAEFNRVVLEFLHAVDRR